MKLKDIWTRVNEDTAPKGRHTDKLSMIKNIGVFFHCDCEETSTYLFLTPQRFASYWGSTRKGSFVIKIDKRDLEVVTTEVTHDYPYEQNLCKLKRKIRHIIDDGVTITEFSYDRLTVKTTDDKFELCFVENRTCVNTMELKRDHIDLINKLFGEFEAAKEGGVNDGA